LLQFSCGSNIGILPGAGKKSSARAYSTRTKNRGKAFLQEGFSSRERDLKPIGNLRVVVGTDRVPDCPFFAFHRHPDPQERPSAARPGWKKEKGQQHHCRRRKTLEVKVIDNDVEKALKILKNKLSKSGLFKELKVRRAYEKPSVKKKRKTIEARRRLAKVQRRRSS